MCIYHRDWYITVTEFQRLSQEEWRKPQWGKPGSKQEELWPAQKAGPLAVARSQCYDSVQRSIECPSGCMSASRSDPRSFSWTFLMFSIELGSSHICF